MPPTRQRLRPTFVTKTSTKQSTCGHLVVPNLVPVYSPRSSQSMTHWLKSDPKVVIFSLSHVVYVMSSETPFSFSQKDLSILNAKNNQITAWKTYFLFSSKNRPNYCSNAEYNEYLEGNHLRKKRYKSIHVNMYTCIHVYMRTCIHVYMHTCIHAQMHTCIRVYMYTCIHVYMYTLF